MHPKERAKKVQEVLESYFPNPKPLLHFTNHFTLLIATLLSAQSTDEQVNRVTVKLFHKARTPKAMIALTREEIEKIIRPVGLYKSKARAILALSHQLIDEFGGKVPSSFEALESLSGVGHKTASVVISQGFHKPAFAVDTHIFRSARRWGLSKAKNRKEVEEDLKRLYPERSWSKLHLQMVSFARVYCKARGHDKKHCPLCSMI